VRKSRIQNGGEDWGFNAVETALGNIALLIRTFDGRAAVSELETAIGYLTGHDGNDVEFALFHKGVSSCIVEGHQFLFHMVHALPKM